MNDSSRGAPPTAGYWGAYEQGAGPAVDAAREGRPADPAHEGYPAAAAHDGYAAGPGHDGRPVGTAFDGYPAGPAHDGRDAQQTRPMPIVPDGPAGGGDQDDDRGAARQDGPAPRARRDDTPQEPVAVPQPAPPESPEQPRSAEPPKKRAGRDLPAAIGVGVGLGAVVAASLFIVKAVFVGVIAVAVVIGLWELTTRLSEQKGIKPPLVPLAVGGAAMVVAGYARGPEGAWVAMALTALAVLIWRMTEPPEGYLKDVTAGLFAAFYVPFLATFVALILTADDGPWRVLMFLVLTVVSDTGAYAVGWRFGRHKLAPRISPGKTREGLAGAVVFAMVAGALCMQFMIDNGVWWQGLLLGLAVAASATLGDLGESMIKRDLGIKDMGTLLPGHGGIMDRLDSLLPTAPVMWLLLVLFVGS
ncbi:phosphatidate cytidylyltransferase [Streptomyces hebeiensis]